MREILVKVTCDECAKSVDEEEAVNVEFTVGRATYETDLCSSCIATHVGRSRLKKKRAGRDGAADKVIATTNKAQRKS